MGLLRYQQKRDFQRTPEPKGHAVRTKKRSCGYVVQKHAATRLHYDFRLEMEGVLKSWAVPKGIPTKRGDKRLAMQVEDHPVDYGSFEGTIPEGNYGAGTVMLWDNGDYEAVDGDAMTGLRKGKLRIRLKGKKLNGEWTLVKMRGREERNKQPWLLIKSGKDMEPLTAEEEDRSVTTGRSMEEIGSGRSRVWKSNRSAATSQSNKRTVASAAKTLLKSVEKLPKERAEYVSPMKALLVKEPPRDSDWVYEIKWDGYRAIAVKQDGEVRLFSRRAREVTADFAEIADAVANIAADQLVIDGEVVALDEKGRPSFQLLQQHRGGKTHLYYYVFDLLNLQNRNVRGLPLLERKARLKRLLEGVSDPIRFSSEFRGDSKALLAEATKNQIEGLIAKRPNSIYEADRRSGAWIKIKTGNEQEFVIGGYTEPKGSRQNFGSILVGYYDKGHLRFASKVGTGFDTELLETLYKRFQRLKTDKCPFVNIGPGKSAEGLTPAEIRRCTWVKPELVCQVRFTEWTEGGGLRHPVYAGLRDDKAPKEVVREMPVS